MENMHNSFNVGVKDSKNKKKGSMFENEHGYILT